MKNFFHPIIFIAIIVLAGCAPSQNPLKKEVQMLQKGKRIDTLSYVYDLPYPKGKSYWMIQGYFSKFTHKERAALDFKMPVGSVVCAARDGVVVRLKEDGNQGGAEKSARAYANFVVIQHADNSRSGYWHLKHNGVLVQLGDSVKKGQPIALSGNTGYTYLPHLHFIVWNFDKQGKFQQTATRFHTAKGTQFLKPLRRYKNPF
jgi:murein DD-endopeptidase MepM/ murein hydrolase activator NlpD